MSGATIKDFETIGRKHGGDFAGAALAFLRGDTADPEIWAGWMNGRIGEMAGQMRRLGASDAELHAWEAALLESYAHFLTVATGALREPADASLADRPVHGHA